MCPEQAPPVAVAFDHVTVRFGGVKAVDELSFSVSCGELVGLIGPNGCGKTTVLNALTGLAEPERGWMQIGGARLRRVAPHRVCSLGVSRTFQDVRLFSQFTVLDNLLVAFRHSRNLGLVGATFGRHLMAGDERQAEREALRCLGLVGLEARAQDRASNLSFGQMKLVSLARALVNDPEILLLDEPTAALAPPMVSAVRELLRLLRGMGKTILIVEHDLGLLMTLCDRVIRLHGGRRDFDGTPDELRNALTNEGASAGLTNVYTASD
jgi:ABC-type branched-subunit amino acid transport system ATPase component